jgi:hypothetical protein
MIQRICIFAWVLCVILVVTSPVLAGQKGAGSTTPTTATFRNNCFWPEEGFLCSGPPDRIGSDHIVPFPYTYINGVEEVKAIIDAAGEFVLDTNTNTGRIHRSLYVDVRDAVPPGKGPPDHPNWELLGYGWVDAYVITREGAFTGMRYGDAPRSVGLAVNFPYWSLHFGFSSSEETDTDKVQVTCMGSLSSDSPCDTWEIEAVPPATRAKLLLVSRKGQTEDYGNFYMPFKLTVRKLTQ